MKNSGKLFALIIFSCLILWQSVLGQIPVGTWRTHLSYNHVVSVTAHDDIIFAASEAGVFILDQASGTLSKITRLDGLSDAGITTIGYNLATNTLIIAYENGNIDLLRDSKIINYNELLINERVGSKRINHIHSVGPLAYMSSDFGILILDLERIETKETLFNLGPSGEALIVHSATVANDSLFLATDLGIMAGNLNDNLKDFSLWYRYSPVDGIPSVTAKAIVLTNEGILCGVDNFGLYTYNAGIWTQLNQLENRSFVTITQLAETIIVCPDTVYTYSNAVTTALPITLLRKASDGFNEGGFTWIADQANGLIKFSSSLEESVYPNGPVTNQIVKIKHLSGKTIALPKAYSNNFEPLRVELGYSIFDQEAWSNYNSSKNPKTIETPEFLDVTDAGYSPSLDEYYFSSFGYGLLKMTASGFEILDENTPGSPLENTNPPARNVLVTSLSTRDQNLFMANYNALFPLHQLDQNSAWQSFQPQLNNAKYTTQLLSTDWQDHWMVLNDNFGGGIIVFNDQQGTIFLSSDVGKGGLPDNTVNDIVLDLEQKLWVATDKGVVYYPFPSSILQESGIDPVIPIFESSQLFRNETVTALAVDGGNRMWMGTNQGLWLFANDGQTLEEYFTVDNSPLLSNKILDIAVVDNSGEVFVATDKGVISYRGTATRGIEAVAVKIYPNPVHPSFSGLITIEGVPTDASVTVTDISGRLIYSTTAHGNTATWDGLSLSGKSVPTGIYLVFVASDDKAQKQVGKIAMIN
jgi:hypothetical protein